MRKQHLTFKFTLMFLAFVLITLAVSSVFSYYNQTKLFQTEQEHNIQYVASYLEQIVSMEGTDFLNMQDYFIPHSEDFKIFIDFDEKTLETDWNLFEYIYNEQNYGKILDQDISFEALSDEVKKAYSLYYYEYYRLLFEKATKEFNLAYAYYIVPTGEDNHICWFLETLREPQKEGSPYLNICVDAENSRAKYPHLWEAWNTGCRPSGYDTFDNEHGKTYAYYTPVFINGEKSGIIGVEIEIAKVNAAILYGTFRQMLAIAIILVIFTFCLLVVIRKFYIKKLIKIQNVISEYSQTKDSELAKRLLTDVTNEDEISGIMEKLSDMIYELELYMYNLNKTKRELNITRKQTIELNELAIKDSLTGIRNKNGYDKEVQKLEWEMAEGFTGVGVAMIDLNFLKRINDTYGHEKGNIALVSLSRIICNTFAHSPVFRIGGDEFVVILKCDDLDHVEERVAKFNATLKELQDNPNLEYWEKTSAAIGYAIYDPQIDSAYENIFRRADTKMYHNKKIMKASRD